MKQKLVDIESLQTKRGRFNRWVELFEKQEQELPEGKAVQFADTFMTATNAYCSLQRQQIMKRRFLNLQIIRKGSIGYIGKKKKEK